MTDGEINQEGFFAPILNIGANALSSFGDRFRLFSYSEVGTVNLLLTLSLLLFTALIAHTNLIIDPFSNLDLSWLIFISLIFTTIGHCYAITLSQDGRWKFAVKYLPYLSSLVLILFAFDVIEITSTGQINNLLGYTIIIQISLLSGILSGEIKSAAWLGNALFMRHINKLLPDMGVKYLYWNTEGELEIVEATELVPRWDESSDMVVCKYMTKEVPFNHFSPVYSRNNRLSSAFDDIMKLFEGLTVTWNDAMSGYKESLHQSELRISWLNIIQVIIPEKTSSLMLQNSRIPNRNQRILLGNKKVIFSWPLPKNDWAESVNRAFKSTQDKPALHIALMTEIDSNFVLEIERKLINSGNTGESLQKARISLLRSYSNLMIMLFENISEQTGNRSDLSKYCTRSMGTWYKSFKGGNSIFEISKESYYNSSNRSIVSMSMDEWQQKINDSIIEPESFFLSIHDKLLNLIEESNCSKEITATIQSLISTCTKDVIKSNSKNPGTRRKETKKTNVSQRRKSSVNRKGAILVGICKMNLVYSLLSQETGGEN